MARAGLALPQDACSAEHHVGPPGATSQEVLGWAVVDLAGEVLSSAFHLQGQGEPQTLVPTLPFHMGKELDPTNLASALCKWVHAGRPSHGSGDMPWRYLEFILGWNTKVPNSPFPTQCPGLHETGTQLHRPKGCCSMAQHGLGSPSLYSLLTCGRENKHWACICRDALAAAVVAQGWPKGKWGRRRLKPDLCLSTSCRVPYHNGTTTLRPSGALHLWDLPGRSTGLPVSWLLFPSTCWDGLCPIFRSLPSQRRSAAPLLLVLKIKCRVSGP